MGTTFIVSLISSEGSNYNSILHVNEYAARRRNHAANQPFAGTAVATRADFDHIDTVILYYRGYCLGNAASPRRFALKSQRKRRMQNVQIGEFHAETLDFDCFPGVFSRAAAQRILDFHGSTLDFVVDPLVRNGQAEMPNRAGFGFECERGGDDWIDEKTARKSVLRMLQANGMDAQRHRIVHSDVQIKPKPCDDLLRRSSMRL